MSKLLLGGLIGGVVYFFGGWLLYGIALKNAMPMPEGLEGLIIPEEEYKISLMAISCLVYGFLLSYILNIASVTSASRGAIIGAVVGALTAITVGLSYAAGYTFGSINNTFVDAGASAVLGAVTGGAIGWFFGRK